MQSLRTWALPTKIMDLMINFSPLDQFWSTLFESQQIQSPIGSSVDDTIQQIQSPFLILTALTNGYTIQSKHFTER